jgi:Tol biopolymer transport system component
VRKQIGGAGKGEVVFESTTEMYPCSVSPNVENLAFQRGGDDSSWDVWILPLSRETEAYPFIKTEFGESLGMFSPDGRWIAYVSNESGRPEIYVTAFPDAGRKWQISDGGGSSPRWNATGGEIVYHASNGVLTAVQIERRDGGLLIGETKPLFNTGLQPATGHFWALSDDGEKILALETIDEGHAPNISVVVNWPTSRSQR